MSVAQSTDTGRVYQLLSKENVCSFRLIYRQWNIHFYHQLQQQVQREQSEKCVKRMQIKARQVLAKTSFGLKCFNMQL